MCGAGVYGATISLPAAASSKTRPLIFAVAKGPPPFPLRGLDGQLNNGRNHLTVQSSMDGGRSFGAGQLVTSGYSGYVSLAALPVGQERSVGVLWEGGAAGCKGACAVKFTVIKTDGRRHDPSIKSDDVGRMGETSLIIRTFEECGTHLCKDGVPFQVISASFHFFRSHPSEWARRLSLIKACGFNTISTYLPWFLLEPFPTQFSTAAGLDVVQFVKEAAAAGLLVSIRAGPYITAEVDFGGYPWWLLRDTSTNLTTTFRTVDPQWTKLVSRFWDRFIPPLAQQQYENGGPVISFQVCMSPFKYVFSLF